MCVQQTKVIYSDKRILGSYLAGLWEGDGHITISKNGKRGFT
jgi:intein/homing endonuclease